MTIIPFERRSPVAQMERCELSEVCHILGVIEEAKVKCSLEIKISGSYLDNFLSVGGEVPISQYEELDIGDCLSITMGNAEIGFEVTSQCFKHFDTNQINLAIANERYHMFLLTRRIPSWAMRKAESYVEADDL